MTSIQDAFHACTSEFLERDRPALKNRACRKIKRHLESITVMVPLLARSSDLLHAWSIVKEASVYVR